MDQRERHDDLFEALRSLLDGRQVGIWTALPGIIQSFDAGVAAERAPTCVVQPAIQGRVTSLDPASGQTVTKFVNLPQLLDCPVQFPGGGGCSLTFPVKKGDECLVVFASRCIDAWWAQGGIQPPMEARMHDLSDGFVLLGYRSSPRAIANISTTKTQLRSDDGQAYVELDPTGHIVNAVAPGGFNVTGPLTVHGAVSITGGATIDTLKVTTSADLDNGNGTYIKTVAGQSTTAKA
jgi:hypothetical protein